MMKQLVLNKTVLHLEDFPPFRTPCQGPAITKCLETLVRNRLNPNLEYLEFPSMSRLSGFFGCSFMEIYDAFRSLRNHGWDYQFSSIDGGVLVWQPRPS